MTSLFHCRLARLQRIHISQVWPGVQGYSAPQPSNRGVSRYKESPWSWNVTWGGVALYYADRTIAGWLALSGQHKFCANLSGPSVATSSIPQRIDKLCKLSQIRWSGGSQVPGMPHGDRQPIEGSPGAACHIQSAPWIKPGMRPLPLGT